MVYKIVHFELDLREHSDNEGTSHSEYEIYIEIPVKLENIYT